MSAIWESTNWTRQFGIRQTGNRQFVDYLYYQSVAAQSLQSTTRISKYLPVYVSPVI
jgi:hypothetical protein